MILWNPSPRDVRALRRFFPSWPQPSQGWLSPYYLA
jgi:hypothetical protein